MNLKDFVKQAVVDIATAVSQADQEIQAVGGLVNPGSHTLSGSSENRKEYFVYPRTTLNFDVAISASSESGAEGAASAKIWVVQASIGSSETVTASTVSRLSFSIDVVLPSPKDQKDRVGLVQGKK